MNRIGYQRLIEARYSYLQRHGLSETETKEIDYMLEQSRPQREISFVELSKRAGARSRAASKGPKEPVFIGETV